jgi:hypothetical protein
VRALSASATTFALSCRFGFQRPHGLGSEWSGKNGLSFVSCRCADSNQWLLKTYNRVVEENLRSENYPIFLQFSANQI